MSNTHSLEVAETELADARTPEEIFRAQQKVALLKATKG